MPEPPEMGVFSVCFFDAQKRAMRKAGAFSVRARGSWSSGDRTTAYGKIHTAKVRESRER